MSSAITPINNAPYLRTTREFPEEVNGLAFQVNKSYLDVAAAVNNRTIGLYPVNRPAITGNIYYITGSQRQQTLRQVYTFTTTANIPHRINVLDIYGFTPFCYGSYQDSSKNIYGIIFSTSNPIPGQLGFYITPNSSPAVLDGNIVFVPGAGPSPPTLVSGIIVLEWISLV